jgi:hypothetical protein
MNKTTIHKFALRFALLLSIFLAPVLSQPAIAGELSMDHASMDHMSMTGDGHDMSATKTASENCTEHCANQIGNEQTCISDCLQQSPNHFAFVIENLLGGVSVAQNHNDNEVHMEPMAKIVFVPPPPRA